MKPEAENKSSAQAFGVLADRVDSEPPAILGLTTSELLLVSLTTGLVLLPLILLIAFAFGIPSDIYGFYPYTTNSICPSHTLD